MAQYYDMKYYTGPYPELLMREDTKQRCEALPVAYFFVFLKCSDAISWHMVVVYKSIRPRPLCLNVATTLAIMMYLTLRQ